jgi:hypothetical protein
MEFHLLGKKLTELKVILAFLSVFVLVLTDTAVNGGRILANSSSVENRIFGAVLMCSFSLLLAVVIWFWVLLAVHVKYATLNGQILIGRVLAPQVRLSKNLKLRTLACAVPAWNAPYYQRGVLLFRGMTAFFVSGYVEDSRSLLDQLASQCHIDGAGKRNYRQ